MSSATRSTRVFSTTTGGRVEGNLSRTLADVRPDRVARIRRPRVAKHQPRVKAPAFDASLVSKTLSPNA